MSSSSDSVAPNCFIFSSEEAAKQSFPGETVKSAVINDPSYVQSFEAIMSPDEDLKVFLMSFLNSIYYPNSKDDELRIRRIEAIASPGSVGGDMSCRCFCFPVGREEQGHAFEIVIETAARTSCVSLLMGYALKMYNKNPIPTRALGLLNVLPDAPFDDKSACFAWCPIDAKTNYPVPQPVDQDTAMQVNLIDLRVLRETDEVSFCGNKLGIMGITWLKLFGVRQWGVCERDPWRFKIFYPESTDLCIQRTIELLTSNSQKEYEFYRTQYLLEEGMWSTYKLAALIRGKAEGTAEGRAEGIAEGKAEGKAEGLAEGGEIVLDLIGDKLPPEQVEELKEAFLRKKRQKVGRDD